MNNALSDLIDTIKNSNDYKKCIELKEKMNNNSDIKSLVSRIKVLQKKSLRYYDDSIDEELKRLTEELNSIPIYHEYNKYLTLVNEKISYINDELNDYFYNLLNK